MRGESEGVEAPEGDLRFEGEGCGRGGVGDGMAAMVDGLRGLRRTGDGSSMCMKFLSWRRPLKLAGFGSVLSLMVPVTVRVRVRLQS